VDIICLDTPSGEVVEISSSYDLSIFSPGADSPHTEGVGATPVGSSPSIGELWPDIDKLDEINREHVSTVHIHEVALHDSESLVLNKKTNKQARRRGGGKCSKPMLLGHLVLCRKATERVPRRKNLRKICPLPPEQFLLVCRGHLLMGNIHLRLIWIEVNGKLF
jgi:hypothetical protein